MGVHNFHTNVSKYNLWEEMGVIVRKREERGLREKCIFLYSLASQVFIEFSIETTQTNISLCDNSSTQASRLTSQVSILFRLRKQNKTKNKSMRRKQKYESNMEYRQLRAFLLLDSCYASYDL